MKVYESDWLAIAARQHGVISHRQLLDAGISTRQANLRVARGMLRRLHRGVYAVAGRAETVEQRAMAACLAAAGVASHRCAAALWELRGCESGLIEVTVAARRRPELRGVVGHTTDHLPAVDVTERMGIPVTTPARTLLDLAVVTTPVAVERVLEDALHRNLVSLSWLARTLARSHHTRPGAGVVGALLASRDPALAPSESILEDMLITVLRDGGLPEPVRQHQVALGDGRFVRLDLSYPPRRVAIEAQGLASHSRARDLQRDCDKRNLLVRLGWQLLVYTWHDVTRRPAYVVDTARAALGL